jgi:hypothetical protein
VQVRVAGALVAVPDLGCVRVAGIRREPLLERPPVQRLVAVPVVLARRDRGDGGEAGRLDLLRGLVQRDEALVVDPARQRPLPPVRLADDNVAARANRRRECFERSGEVVPDKARAEAEGRVPGFRLERIRVRVGLDDLDQLVNGLLGNMPAGGLRELR